MHKTVLFSLSIKKHPNEFLNKLKVVKYQQNIEFELIRQENV